MKKFIFFLAVLLVACNETDSIYNFPDAIVYRKTGYHSDGNQRVDLLMYNESQQRFYIQGIWVYKIEFDKFDVGDTIPDVKNVNMRTVFVLQ